MIKRFTLFLIFGVVLLLSAMPVTATARTRISVRQDFTTQYVVQKKQLSDRKLRKLQRWKTKITERWAHAAAQDSAAYWLWMGLFGLGLGLCLALFSTSLAGIVSAAALGCLFIWGFFKLGAL